MTYFLDNTFSIRFAKVLQVLGEDVHHLQEDFPPDTKDENWIPIIGERGWIIVTGDNRIRTKQVNKIALKKANIPAVFMYDGFTNETIWNQISRFTLIWPDIRRTCCKPGVCYNIGRKGKITEITDW